MCVAAILESGGPLPSMNEAVHEFSYPGVYTCEESELSPLWHATRARIQAASHKYDVAQHSAWPMCQFVFRGAETVTGLRTRKTRTYGNDMQLIYERPGSVAWYELQVWIGVAPVDAGDRHGLYDVSPVWQDSRRTTRLVKRQCTKLQLGTGCAYSPVVGTLDGDHCNGPHNGAANLGLLRKRSLEVVRPKEVPLRLVVLHCSGMECLSSSVRMNKASWTMQTSGGDLRRQSSQNCDDWSNAYQTRKVQV